MKLLTRFDPRLKLPILLYGITTLFLPIKTVRLAILVAVVLLVSVATLRKQMVFPILSITPILVITLVVTPLLYTSGKPLWSIQERAILTTDGLEEALRLIARFTGITSLFALFHYTTSPGEFIATLRWYRLSYRASLVLNMITRFIPSLLQLYSRVDDAHRMRRSREFQQNSRLFRRVRTLIPTLTSVLILTLRRIEPLSMSLELRGIGSTTSRTNYHRLRQHRGLAIQFAIAILGMILLGYIIIR